MKIQLVIAALITAISLPAQSQGAPETLAVVNGVAVPAIFAEFSRQARANRGAEAQNLTPEAIRDAVIAAELLSQEAVRRGLDKNPRVVAAIDFQRKEMLSQALLEDFLRANPLSEEIVKAEYEQAKARAGTMEYRPRHILVNTEREARNIIASLTTAKRRANFEDVARKQSKDTSASNGGDLGWVLPANMVPEFAAAMTRLKKGEVSRVPVQTQFGWHVIRMDDTRKLDFPPYEELRNRIAGQIQQVKLRRFIAELRATAKIE